MTTAEYYRSLAADAEAHSRLETVPVFRREWEGLAQTFRRLAEDAEREALADEARVVSTS